jgi:glutaminase
MICQSNTELQELVDEAKRCTHLGKVANYIPALGKADPSMLSIAIYEVGGDCTSAGNIKDLFTLQSVSKIITLALAIIDHGAEKVFDRVGMEPTGDPFNSIAKLESLKPSKPLNPMINAGALAVTDMIKGNDVDEKLERILRFIYAMTENHSISYSKEVAVSEYETSHLNRALCYFMKQHGGIDGDVESLIDLYTKQCAIEVNCLDLGRIGAVFANNGVDPETGKVIVPADVARICKTFMVTCGMYNASGEFAIKIGIPAKSGVSGAILGALPGRFGIGICGPALDDKGNSIGGIKLLELLSERYELSMF